MKKDHSQLLVTPALLTDSPNPYVQEQKSRDWMIRADNFANANEEDENARQRKSKLGQLLADVLRVGLRYDSQSGFKEFSGSDLQRRFSQGDVDEFRVFLEKEVGFTKEQIERLDAGYSQQLESIPLKMVECGSNGLLGNPTRILTSGGHKAEFLETQEGALLIRAQFFFRYNQLEAPEGRLLKTLPPITATCEFTDAAKEQGAAEFIYADVPLLYAPLMFSNQDFDFQRWYEYLTGEVAAFAPVHTLRVPEVLVGANQQTVPLDVTNLDLDSPISDDESRALRGAFRKGQLRFAGLVSSEFPKGVATDSAEGKQLYNDYFNRFFESIPKGNNAAAEMRLYRAINRQWLALSKQYKGSDITIAYDPIRKTAVFRVAEPYQFSEASEHGVVRERIRRTFDTQAADLLEVAKPKPEAFRVANRTHASDKPNGIQLVVSPNEPTGELAPNTVYAYIVEGTTYNAFYVDPTGKAHKSISVEDQNDGLLSTTTRDQKATDTHLLELATYQYRVEQFHQAYLLTAEQVRRRTTVDAVMTTLEPLMGTVGTFSGRDFGIYDISEIPGPGDDLNKPYRAVQDLRNSISRLNDFRRDSEQITDQEWAQFIRQLETIYPDHLGYLRTNLPEPKSGKHDREAIEGLVDAIKEQAENALQDEYQNTPLGRANQHAIAKAWNDPNAIQLVESGAKPTDKLEPNTVYAYPGKWGVGFEAFYVDPTGRQHETISVREDEKDSLLEKATRQYRVAPLTEDDQRVLADPRIILLTTQDTHISDGAYRGWDEAYALLATAGYEGLDALNDSLQQYSQNVFALSNAERQEAAVALLKGVQRELKNTHLPVFIKSDVKKAYAQNTAPLAVLERALAHELSYLQEVQQLQGELKVGAITDARRVRLGQQQPVDPLQQAIFKSFKDANRRLPTPEQLEQYAGQVVATEQVLVDVEQAITAYLTQSKGITIGNGQGEIAPQQFIQLQGLTEDQCHDRKVYQAALVLGLIVKFHARHGNALAVARDDDALVDIEDYSAILSALHAILKRSNEKDHWYDRSHNFRDAMTPALGANPKKTLAFAPELALQLADYEKALYEKHQEDRFFLFKSEFEEDKAALRSTASNEAVIDSGRYTEKAQAAIAGAQTIEELEEAEASYLPALSKDVTEDSVQELRDSGEGEKVRLGRFQHAFAQKPTKRGVAREFLEFTAELQRLYIDTRLECDAASSVESLEASTTAFSKALTVVLDKYTSKAPVRNSDEVRRTYVKHLQAVQTAFDAKYRTTKGDFEQARMEYWNQLMSTVRPTVDGIGKATDVKEIVSGYNNAKEIIEKVTLPEEFRLATDHKAEVCEQAIKLITTVKNNRLKVLLKGEVKRYLEETALPVVQAQIDLQKLNDRKTTASEAIDALVSRSGLSAEDGEAVVVEYRGLLEDARKAQKNFIKSQPAFRKLSERYQPQVEEVSVSELPAVLLEAAEAIEAIPAAKAHQEVAFKGMADDLKNTLVIPAIGRYIEERLLVIEEAKAKFLGARFDEEIDERNAEAAYCDAVKETIETIGQMVPKSMQTEDVSAYQLEGMIPIAQDALHTMAPIWGLDTGRKQKFMPDGSEVKRALAVEMIELGLVEGFRQFEREEKYAALTDALEASIRALVAIRAGFQPEDVFFDQITSQIETLEDLVYSGQDRLMGRLGEIPLEIRTAAVGLYAYRMEQFIRDEVYIKKAEPGPLLQQKIQEVSEEFYADPQLPSDLIAALQVRVLREEYAPLINNALRDYQQADVKDSAKLALRNVVIGLAEAINIHASGKLNIETIRALPAEELEAVATVLTDIRKDFPGGKEPLFSLEATVLADELFETVAQKLLGDPNVGFVLTEGKKQICTQAIEKLQHRLEAIFSQEKKPAVDELLVSEESDELLVPQESDEMVVPQGPDRAQQIGALVGKLNQFVDARLGVQKAARDADLEAAAKQTVGGVINAMVPGQQQLAYYWKAVDGLAESLQRAGVKKEDIPEKTMKQFLYRALHGHISQMATDFAAGKLSYKVLEAKIDGQLEADFDAPKSKPAEAVREHALERVLSLAYWRKVQHRPKDKKGKRAEVEASQLDRWIAARFNVTTDYHQLKREIRIYLTQNNFNHLSVAKRNELVNSTLTTIDEMVFRIHTQLYSLVEQQAAIAIRAEEVQSWRGGEAKDDELARLDALNQRCKEKIQQVIRSHPEINPPQKEFYEIGGSTEQLTRVAEYLRGISDEKAKTVKRGQQAISRKEAMLAEAKESIDEAIFEVNPVREEPEVKGKVSVKAFAARNETELESSRRTEVPVFSGLPSDNRQVTVPAFGVPSEEKASKRRDSKEFSDVSSEEGELKVADQKKRDDKPSKASTYHGSILMNGKEDRRSKGKPLVPETHRVRFVEPSH